MHLCKKCALQHFILILSSKHQVIVAVSDRFCFQTTAFQFEGMDVVA